MKLNDIMFSLNDYDRDGGLKKNGIYLHFGDTRIYVAENFVKFKAVVNRLSGMVDEIEENWNWEVI